MTLRGDLRLQRPLRSLSPSWGHAVSAHWAPPADEHPVSDSAHKQPQSKRARPAYLLMSRIHFGTWQLQVPGWQGSDGKDGREAQALCPEAEWRPAGQVVRA